MNVQQLLDAASTLKEVGEVFNNMPEEREESAEASLYMNIVHSYLVELAKHLQNGMEPYDAVLKALKDDTPLTEYGIPEERITAFRLLTTKAVKE